MKNRIYLLILILSGIITGSLIKGILGGLRGTSGAVAEKFGQGYVNKVLLNIEKYWSNIYHGVSRYYGGFMTWPLLLLTCPWILFTTSRENKVKSFFNSWLLTLIPIYGMDEYLITRFIYNIPLQVIIAWIIASLVHNNITLIMLIALAISYTSLCCMNLVYHY